VNEAPIEGTADTELVEYITLNFLIVDE